MRALKRVSFLSRFWLCHLGHRFPPALPSRVPAFGLAPYLETDIDTSSLSFIVRKAYKKAVLKLHPDRRHKHKFHPNHLDLDDPQLLLQASLHGTAAVMKYATPPPEPVDPALEKALLVRFQRIQAAYDILAVPEKRCVYDKQMLADEEMSLFGERRALREARREAWRAAHPPPPPVPENLADVKPPFVWDVDRKQPLFWDPNPQPNPAPPSDEPGMQLIRKEDAAASSKYIFTREAAVKRLVEIDDENYGAYKFIKGVSLGAVELQSKDLIPVRRRERRRFDSAATLVAHEPVSALPPKDGAEIPEPPKPEPPKPEPPKKADIRRTSQIVRLAQTMTTADMQHARLKLEREQALLTQIEAVKSQEEVHRLRVERERQRAQLELQMRMAMIEKQRERLKAEEELEKLRVEQAKLAAATAQLSAQVHVWPQQVQVTQKPQRRRVNSDVGRQKQDIWPTKEVANEWSAWDAGGWGNVQPTGADAGWDTTWNGDWDNPNHHPPLHQKQESRKSRTKEHNANNARMDDWDAPPPAKDKTDINRKTRSRSKSFSVGKAETKQQANLREGADYWEQTQPNPEEKHQPRKLTKPAKVKFDMVDVPPQFRPYELPEESKGTLSGFKRLFGRT